MRLNAWLDLEKKAGFKVVEEYFGDNEHIFDGIWRTPGIYDIHFGGHGKWLAKKGKYYAFISSPTNGTVSSPATINTPLYKLAEISARHCGGWRDVDWRQFVSTNGGKYSGLKGRASLANLHKTFKKETVK